MAEGVGNRMLIEDIDTAIESLEVTPATGTVCSHHGSLAAGLKTVLRVQRYQLKETLVQAAEVRAQADQMMAQVESRVPSTRKLVGVVATVSAVVVGIIKGVGAALATLGVN